MYSSLLATSLDFSCILSPTHQMKTNVWLKMFAQSMQPATTLLEAIIVCAIQDLNLVEKGQCSRAWKDPVKVGEGFDQELKIYWKYSDKRFGLRMSLKLSSEELKPRFLPPFFPLLIFPSIPPSIPLFFSLPLSYFSFPPWVWECVHHGACVEVRERLWESVLAFHIIETRSFLFLMLCYLLPTY